MPHKRLRKKFFVDRKVQGALVLKAAGYWLLSLFVVGALTVLGWIFVTPGLEVLVGLRDQLPSFIGGLFVSLLASLIVLPVLLIDMTRHTNRFAGPIFRLQRVMKQVAEGRSVEPLEFRDGDYWPELAQSFNGILERIEAQQSADCNTLLEFETVCPAQTIEEPVNV